MEVFAFREELVAEYKRFARRFTDIRSSDVSRKVDVALVGGSFCSAPHVQLSPHCKAREWGEAKNSACFERRGFDFAHAVRAFLDPHRIVAQDRRRDYGEDRYRLLGTVDGRVYVVVYTVRGSAVRIILARKANAKEVADDEHNAHQD